MPACDARRSNLAEAEVGVGGRDVGECCPKPMKSSLEATRIVEALRRGGCIGGLTNSGCLPFSSFPNLVIDVDDGRREIESLRLLISFRGRRHWNQ